MIKHFKAKASLASLFLLFAFSAQVLNAFSSQDIISPANGVWNNTQALVLNVWDESELYYSFSGSDPLTSGFSYDGPILIDATGQINITITAVSKEGKRSDFKVSYTVNPSTSVIGAESDAVFVSNLYQSPIVKISKGSPFVIPEGFTYTASHDDILFLEGSSLEVASENVLERYVPCVIKKDNLTYHVVLHTVPENQSVLNIEKEDLPFEISNWTDFRFTGKKLIYRVDDTYWTADENVIKLDRSVPHTIFWQSMAFELGNPVETFVLPPVPNLVSRELENGAALYELESSVSGYTMGLSSENLQIGKSSDSVVSDKLVIDTFRGDEINSEINFNIYYKGNFQGVLSSFVDIDRKPPKAPEIVSSAKKSSSRDKVVLTINAGKGEKVFYSLSNPVFAEGSEGLDLASISASSSGFTEYDGKNIELGSVNDSATCYRLLAYAVDGKNNVSSITEYSVIIDEYNAYLDPSSGTEGEGDGSLLNPFKTFAAAVKYVNSRRSTKLHVISPVMIKNQSIKITSECCIIGQDTSFTLEGNSVISVEKANVTFRNCFFTRNDSDKATSGAKKMFNIKNSTVLFDNVEVLGVFKGDSSVVASSGSVLMVKNSGFTIQGPAYCCLFNLEKTEFTADSSRFTSSSETAVCFSAHDGKFYMTGSTCFVQGNIGRCIELSSVKDVVVKGSSLSSKNTVSSSSSNLFWADKKSVVTVYEDNDENVL